MYRYSFASGAVARADVRAQVFAAVRDRRSNLTIVATTDSFFDPRDCGGTCAIRRIDRPSFQCVRTINPPAQSCGDVGYEPQTRHARRGGACVHARDLHARHGRGDVPAQLKATATSRPHEGGYTLFDGLRTPARGHDVTAPARGRTRASGGEVVCAIVGGPSSQPAVRLAARLAERLSLQLALIGVQPPITPPGPATVEGGLPFSPMAIDLAPPPEQVKPDPAPSAEPDAVLATDQPARRDTVFALAPDALRQLSEAPETRLLVVADEGGGALASVFGDNPGREALRHVSCPLVLVPDALSEPAGVRNILCGVDDDDVTADVAFAAWDLADLLRGRLRFVHVVRRAVAGGEPQARDLAELDENRRDAARTAFDACRAVLPPDALAEFVAVEGDAADGLLAAAEDLDAGFIVIGRPERGPVRAALMGSTAHDLLREGRFAIIVVPPDADGG